MGISVGKLSVHNPVLINIVMVALFVLGGFSLMRLPREQFSEIPFYWVFITVPYPGVSAEDIEQTVTADIEEQLDGIPNVKQISSTTREGIALLQVEFEEGISDARFEQLYQRTQTELGKVDLPDGVLDPLIEDFSSADFLPVVEVIMSGGLPFRTINNQSEVLQDRILEIPGVSGAERVGARDPELRVAVDRAKVEALGIGLNEISAAIERGNATTPAGNLTTRSREYVVRTLGELRKVEEFGDIVVRKLPTGESIRVGQLAAVRDTFDRASVDLRFNGQTAVSIRVSKQTDADAISIVREIRDAVRRYREIAPDGIQIDLFNNSTVQIRRSLRVLITNAITGFILVVVTLFSFLGLRNALVTALGIPLTFALTFVFMEWYGESLNGNSLFALVLVLGLIVDHAIVIIENGYRYRQQGLSAEDAAIAGTDEVVTPILAATLTTVAAFLPLMLVPGTIGKFLRIIPLVASFALTASMLEAYFFLPAHFAHWGTAPKQEPGKGFFSHMTERFRGFLARTYEHKTVVAIGSLVAAAIVLALTGVVRQDLFQGDEYSRFYIDMELAPGAPREKTNEVASRYEEVLLPLVGKGEIADISTAVGFAVQDNQFIRQNNVAQIQVDLVEEGDRDRAIPEIMRDVRARTDAIAGTFNVQFRMVRGGPPVDPPVSFRLFGDDYDDLSAISSEYMETLGGIDGVYNVEDDLEKGKPELQILVNKSRAEQLGLSARSIGGYIRSAVDGIPVTKFYRGNEEIDVVVSYDPEEQNSVQAITGMRIPSGDGTPIPFSSLAQISQAQGIAAIKRIDGKRQIQVTAEVREGVDAPAINEMVDSVFQARFRQPYPEVRLDLGGEFEEFQNILQQVARLFLIGLFLMYLLLGTQFKSYIQPILIIISIPFAFTGVVLYLLITNTPFSTTVMYAGVALAGIAVNDSIVSISFINDRRREGMSLREAILEGASVRLRPILLTSFTTMAGLLPMAVGIGGRSPVWGPMASTIIFGLIFSTITTLVVMPCWYGVFERIAQKVRKKVGTA